MAAPYTATRNDQFLFKPTLIGDNNAGAQLYLPTIRLNYNAAFDTAASFVYGNSSVNGDYATDGLYTVTGTKQWAEFELSTGGIYRSTFGPHVADVINSPYGVAVAGLNYPGSGNWGAHGFVVHNADGSVVSSFTDPDSYPAIHLACYSNASLGGEFMAMQIIDSTAATALADAYSNLTAGQYIDFTGVGLLNGYWPTTANKAIVTSAACFHQDTLILTSEGQKKISELKAGDMVITKDHGPKPLLWVRGSKVSSTLLKVMPKLRPIKIKALSLGHTPSSDLIVSPQHRVLVSNSVVKNVTGKPEAFVKAKHLVGLAGIEVLDEFEGCEYWHILFEGHEVVNSNGAWTESLYLGEELIKALDKEAKEEIMTLFPDLAKVVGQLPLAREFAGNAKTQAVMSRSQKHELPLA